MEVSDSEVKFPKGLTQSSSQNKINLANLIANFIFTLGVIQRSRSASVAGKALGWLR